MSFDYSHGDKPVIKKEIERSAVKDTKAIMEELRQSNVPAEVILDRERKRQIEQELEEKEEAARRKRRNKGLSLANSCFKDRKRQAESMSFSTTNVLLDVHLNINLFVLNVNGPPLPEKDELDVKGYLQHIRAASQVRIAGGFTSHTGCIRALFESRIDLLSF
uniref:SFM domain-containing protein n=1 Tax=Heterorhabditis bacteriophora TaxID=37862 RepID=A0A1I7XUM8_HETBA